MSKRILILPVILTLLAAGAADAQYGGGMGGGGMGGGMGGGGMGGGAGGARHGGRQQQADQQPPEPPPVDNTPRAQAGSLAKVQIIGVITRIDAANSRVTISYDEVDALNWPRGTTPFQVEKPELLTGLSVGQKVRFHVESQQISSIVPIETSAPQQSQ